MGDLQGTSAPTHAPALMARALAALYLAGAAVGALTLLVAHPEDANDAVLWSNVALAFGGAVALALASVVRRLRPAVLHVALVAGTVLITRAVVYGGEASTFYNLWYVWVGLYFFFFFGRRLGTAHLALVGLAYALALVETSPSSPVARWVMTITTIAIAGIMIDALARMARRREAQAAAALSQLDRVARTDDLTGLPNRRAWDEHLKREIARAAREGSPLSVAMLDIDNFKGYNDRFGHQAGDRMLHDAATSWRGALRATDVIARYGGEEFALALPGAELPAAAGLLERIRMATPAGQRSSVGVVQWDGIESGAELVARADRALYEAKRHGRDRVVAAPAA